MIGRLGKSGQISVDLICGVASGDDLHFVMQSNNRLVTMGHVALFYPQLELGAIREGRIPFGALPDLATYTRQLFSMTPGQCHHPTPMLVLGAEVHISVEQG
ncbi:hypothetical protein TSMEX_002673 [Taenia solium]|eukprot:TsM_000770000 transcript=TsM_000770000 gene=TsM_000770000